VKATSLKTKKTQWKGDKMKQLALWILPALCLLLPSAVVSADVRLTGTVGPISIDDNVIIPRNATVILNRTTIKGNVFVRSGAKLLAYGANIDGNVQAIGSFLVDLRQQTTVGGDVQGERTRTVRVREGSTIEGNVQVKEAEAPVDADALVVNFADVSGDVQAEKSAGRLRVRDSRIGGNLQFVENTSGLYAVKNNDIGGDLQHFKNRGKATIVRNDVGGNLQSKENRPQPTIENNDVEGDLEIE